MALDFKKSFCSKSKFGTFGHWRLPDAFPLPTQSEAKKLVSTKSQKIQYSSMFVVIQVLYLKMMNFHVFGRFDRVEVETSMVWHSQPSVLQNEFPSCSSSRSLGNV